MNMSERRRLEALCLVRLMCQDGRARRIREDVGLSRRQVAAFAGVTAAAVSRWESGDRSPSGECALRYFQVLNSMVSTTGQLVGVA